MTSTTSRRAVLAGVASAPVLSLPALAAQPDPVFAAIERHKAGLAHHTACLDKACAIQEEISRQVAEMEAVVDRGKEEATAKALELFRPTHPDMTAESALELLKHIGRRDIEAKNGAEEAADLLEEGSAADCDSREALFDTVPTTAAGAAAMLAFIRKDAEAGEFLDGGRLVRVGVRLAAAGLPRSIREGAVMKARKAKRKAARKRSASRRRKEPTFFDKYRMPFFDAKNMTNRFWNIKPTGDYATDCMLGEHYAVRFLNSCDGTVGWAHVLACIVHDMIQRGPERIRKNGSGAPGGVVIGFMGTVSKIVALALAADPNLSHGRLFRSQHSACRRMRVCPEYGSLHCNGRSRRRPDMNLDQHGDWLWGFAALLLVLVLVWWLLGN